MSDEELATLMIMRRDMLEEEAIEALQRVLDKRDISAFVGEMNAKIGDMKAQREAHDQERERQRATNRQIPRAMLIVVVAAIAIFSAAVITRAMT
ncbi:hypothetical protein ACQKEU_16650 [Acidovorax sp. NPDC077664]